MYDYTIIGGGIIGLSTAMQLIDKYPNKKILVLEKESQLAYHQTGHNSSVIHAGVYYKPGSFKSKFAKAGLEKMYAFCKAHGIEAKNTGKLIVAVDEKEMPAYEALFQRGLENGLDLKKLSIEEINEREPALKATAGFYVPTTGVVNYVDVANQYAKLAREKGVEICLATEVKAINESSDCVTIETNHKTFQSRFLIACAGLQSDRIAKMAGYDPGMRIVPFRGEYYKISPEKAHLVNGLIYPVPNPDFPFLGVHFTRMLDGSVKVGPNAVLAFKREGYKKPSFDLKDTIDTLTYSGFWKLIGKYLKPGVEEIARSKLKSLFVKNARRYIPELQPEDLSYATCGIRAQALTNKGAMVDDFLMIDGKRSLFVCNAPSPGATASLAIGEYIVDRVTSISK